MTDDRTRLEKAREEIARLDRKDREADDAQLAADIKATFATRIGRRLLLRIIDMTGIYRTTTLTETDREVAMRLGARNVGLSILAAVRENVPDALRNAEQEREEIVADRRHRREEAQKELNAAIAASRNPTTHTN